MQLIGFLCFAIAILAIGANGIFMLISPKVWFRLPFWIRASGSLSKEKYESGWGATQIRLLGAVFVGIVAWFLYSAFSGG
jgi:hypothetical protein